MVSFQSHTECDGLSLTAPCAVAPLYNFEALGTGAFEFEPVTDFQYIHNAESKANAYTVTAKKVNVKVKSDVAKRELKQAHDKRARVTCSNSSQNSFISARYACLPATPLFALLNCDIIMHLATPRASRLPPSLRTTLPAVVRPTLSTGLTSALVR